VEQFVNDVEAGCHQRNGWPDACYGISKLAVIAYTRVLALDLTKQGSKIRVNCCCPGWCATDMSSHRGQKTAEEGSRTPAMLELLAMGEETTGRFFANEEEIEW
jgi:carbonyl reductase 1